MHRIIKLLPRRMQHFLIDNYLDKNHVTHMTVPIFEGPWPQIENEGTFSLGLRCKFRSFRTRPFITIYKDAELVIGDYSRFNDGLNLCAAVSIRIGDHTRMGDMTYIYDTNFHEVSPDMPVKKAPVTIGRNVWIGSRSMILPGSVIGDNSVIGAGSIVSGEIPANTLAAGIPAKPIRSLKIPDGWLRP